MRTSILGLVLVMLFLIAVERAILCRRESENR